MLDELKLVRKFPAQSRSIEQRINFIKKDLQKDKCILNKVVGQQSATLFEKKLRYRSVPVSFAKFFRIHF